MKYLIVLVLENGANKLQGHMATCTNFTLCHTIYIKC